MKIKKLSIKEYKHLSDLNFNFTYPEGHAKYGQPLEKICIIGQSATGKTSILNCIRNTVSNLKKVELVEGSNIWNSEFNFSGNIEFDYKGYDLVANGKNIRLGDKYYEPKFSGGNITQLLPDGLKLMSFGSEMITKEVVSIFNKNPIEFHDKEFGKIIGLNRKIPQQDYDYEFSENIDEDLWFGLLYKILDYRKRFTQMASELISKGTFVDFQKSHNEFQKWSANNENPLQLFADYFNPILNRLNLEVDLVNTEYFIPIKSKITDTVIPISGLSTGTKGLLLSLFPLFELDTNDAMILIDEPERSLFPDVQIEIVSHYRNVSPNSQLIIATHSPFVAAAFEPEERFILYFNEEGRVAVRPGESPLGDDPNDILSNDFKVDYYNDFGKQAYRRYLDLKTKILSEQNEATKKMLIVERAELGDKYNF